MGYLIHFSTLILGGGGRRREKNPQNVKSLIIKFLVRLHGEYNILVKLCGNLRGVSTKLNKYSLIIFARDSIACKNY